MENKIANQLTETETLEMRMVAMHWLDYYYRPLIFPQEYFKHYKESYKHKALRSYIPKLYSDFKEIFVNNFSNPNSYNAYKQLLANPTRETAATFFGEAYHFFDFALTRNTELVKLQMRATVPLGGKLLQIYDNATSKEVQEQTAKVRQFLNMLFLDTYGQWIKSLQGVTNNAVPN